MSKAIKVGTLGVCPVCEGDFKVRHGKLVHHGFQRPGDGQIHGDCFAVGYESYQRSTKGCEDYKASVATKLVSLQKFLAEIPTRTHWVEMRILGRNKIQTTEYALGVTDLYTWTRFVEDKAHETRYAIRQCESEVTRMERLIGAWKLAELRTVTEEQAEALSKAKREEAFQGFLSELSAIDTTDKNKVRLASEAWHKFFSKKNERELGVSDSLYEFRKRDLEPLLIQVGLASRKADGWVKYLYW